MVKPINFKYYTKTGLIGSLFEIIELHLPMLGMKESLNVSNTATEVGYLFLEHSSKISNSKNS